MTPGRIAAVVFSAVWLVYLTTAGGSLGTGDAVGMYEAAVSIVDRGATDVPPHQSMPSWRGIDGKYYLPFGIGQSLYDVPFVLIGRTAAALSGITFGDPDTIPKAVVALGSTVTAAAAAAICFLLAWRLSSDARSSLTAAAALAFGTLLWPYSKFGFNAPLTTALLAAGVCGFITGVDRRDSWRLLGASAAMGAALLTRHETALAAFACLGWLAWRLRADQRRTRLMLAGMAGIGAALVAWMALNAARFGHPFDTGHTPAITFAGLTAFLTSPSGALWLYAPPSLAVFVLWPRVRRGDPPAVLLVVVIVTMSAFYASLDDWLGTRSYGPRYLVPLLPLMVAPLALWLRDATTPLARWAAAALVVAGITLQLPGVVVDFARVGIEAGQPVQSIRRDDWRWAPIRLNAHAAARAVPANVRYLIGTEVPPAGQGTGSIAEQVPFSLDFWWLYLKYLGILPPALMFAGVLVSLVAASALGAAAWRGTVGPDS